MGKGYVSSIGTTLLSAALALPIAIMGLMVAALLEMVASKVELL